MFRYVGLAWDDTQPRSSARARQLAVGLSASPHWKVSLSRSGLQVFTTGARTGVNGIYRLAGDRGIILGRLFRREDIASPRQNDVDLTHQEANGVIGSDGRTLVRDFWGRYVAFFQAASGGDRVLRDPSGSLPCFRTLHLGVSIVFSWLEDVLDMLDGEPLPPVNWDALTAFIRWGALGGQETALEGVFKVQPGESVDLATERSSLLWSAFDVAHSPSTHRGAEAATLLRETVRNTARAWASCYGTVLLRLSGGVDSSILLSCLAPDGTPADVICVNYHSPGSDSDERGYARMAAGRAGRDLIERERDAGFRIERLGRIARTPDPVHYTGRLNTKSDANLAAAVGADALFTGAGGDPLFFEYPRWWPAADYLTLRGWDAGFTAAALDAARLGRTSVWRTLILSIAERAHPSRIGSQGQGQVAALLCASAAEQSIDNKRFIHPHLLRSGLPVGKRTQAAALMHPLTYYDPFEQADAPESVHPLLSQPLVELCLQFPTFVLTEGGHGRALARRAFASDLPLQIAARRSKGGMEEHLRDVLLSNLDAARTLLLDGQLVRRGIVDRAAVEKQLSGTLAARGTSLSQIHALIGVEAWLARWSG